MIKAILFLFLFVSNAIAAAPVVFFSDLTDGPVSGFSGSGTQGAAVSIWGLNFGETRGTGYVTIGGVNLTDSGSYAEWAATTNPTTARGLQRITFYLNSSMSLGSTTISVTTSEGTSATIPFYTRNTGNIYFVATDGSDSNSGATTALPWLTAMKARATVAAGDVVYFRAGQHTERDTTSTTPANYCYINFYNGNHAAGSANNSITFAAYPGELVTFGDGTDTIPKFIRQVGYDPNIDHLDYWTFSKFKVQVYFSISHISTGSYSTMDNTRWVGFDGTTTAAATGTGVGFWFTGNESNSGTKFYGNYIHHVGKALDWEEADGSGYRVGPIYFQGFGDHTGVVDIGWNEFAWNNGQSQFYGHYHTDVLSELRYHDNYVHHTSTAPVETVASTAVFGGGDDNHVVKENYAFITTAYIYNNIFANNGGNIRFTDGTSYGGHGGAIHYYNNTNYLNTTVTSRDYHTGNFASLTFKNNITWANNDGSPDYFYDDVVGWEANATGSNNVYYGLAAGLDVWEDAETSMASTNPLINADFTLQEGSPCRSAGADLSATFTTDHIGYARGASWDIGAHEYPVAVSTSYPQRVGAGTANRLQSGTSITIGAE